MRSYKYAFVICIVFLSSVGRAEILARLRSESGTINDLICFYEEESNSEACSAPIKPVQTGGSIKSLPVALDFKYAVNLGLINLKELPPQGFDVTKLYNSVSGQVCSTAPKKIVELNSQIENLKKEIADLERLKTKRCGTVCSSGGLFDTTQ